MKTSYDRRPIELKFYMKTSYDRRLIELKFYMKTSYDRLAKIYTSSGHMTKMATMPIYSKNSLEPKGQYPWDFECSLGDVDPTRFSQMINLG